MVHIDNHWHMVGCRQWSRCFYAGRSTPGPLWSTPTGPCWLQQAPVAPKWVLARCIHHLWFDGTQTGVVCWTPRGHINIIQHQQQLCYGTACHLNPELPDLPGTGVVMSYVYITLLRFRAAMLVNMGMFILVLATLSYRVWAGYACGVWPNAHKHGTSAISWLVRANTFNNPWDYWRACLPRKCQKAFCNCHELPQTNRHVPSRIKDGPSRPHWIGDVWHEGMQISEVH